MDDNERSVKAILNYILDNCLFAYDELSRINKELVEGMRLDSKADVNHLGAMNRMVQDYLIIRVGGLFDTTEHKIKGGVERVVSFEKLFSENEEFKKIKDTGIIKYMKDQRHNFVGHNNQDHIENNFPTTSKICNSNLKELLLQLKKLIN